MLLSFALFSPSVAQAQPAIFPSSAISGGAHDYVEAAVLCLLLLTLLFVYISYRRRFRRFEARYAELTSKLPRILRNEDSGITSPGEVYALASRGPNYAFEAELKSAEMRWRHIVSAFPQLYGFEDSDHKKIILAPALYTKLKAVHDMQGFVAQRIKSTFGTNHVVVPEWISDLKEDFDALRHPELAIANSAFYTLPFFLTWQRRHLWGVLPYAIHSRLGVIVHRDHPKRGLLQNFQDDYQKRVSNESVYGLWVSDPKLAEWLSALLDVVDVKPVRLERGLPDLREQHTRATLFTVGAYLQQEILPLTCAVLGRSEVAAAFAAKAQRIEPTELARLLPESTLRILVDHSASHKADTASQGVHPWQTSSAVVVDLALCQEPSTDSELKLFRLPHCVYVPIGIGYSVLSWPLVGGTVKARKWGADLLVDAAQALSESQEDLRNIGIELDQRLWQHLQEHKNGKRS